MNPSHPPAFLVRLGVRPLAVLFVMETMFWYALPALTLRDGEPARNVSTFWLFAYLFGPLYNLLFALGFRHVYLAGGRTHPWIFWGTLIFGLSPWVWVALLLSLGEMLAD